MTKRTCAITGATGFLGSHIAQIMKEAGWSVIKMQREKDQDAESEDKIVYFSIGENIEPETLANVDVLIHCAYDFSSHDRDYINKINVNGTKSLFETAKKANVGRIVFISAMEAFEGCKTVYGQAKLAGEKYALDQGGIVIRLGTIYLEENGKLCGGVGGKTLESFDGLIRKSPVVPVLHTKPTIYTSHVHDICELIEETVSMNKGLKPISAVNEKPMTMKQFFVKIKERQPDNKVLFIPIPWQIPFFAISFLEAIKLNLSFRSDSITNFLDQNPDPDFSIFDHLKTRFRSF